MASLWSAAQRSVAPAPPQSPINLPIHCSLIRSLTKPLAPVHVFQDGVDLLEKLITYDPQRRISMQDALEHPYLQNVGRPARFSNNAGGATE